MTYEDGYITDLTLDEAVAILNSTVFNLGCARANGKTRMIFNVHAAWLKVLASLPLETERKRYSIEDCTRAQLEELYKAIGEKLGKDETDQ